MSTNIIWKSFSRDALSDTIFGNVPSRHLVQHSFVQYDFSDDRVAVGFLRSKIASDYTPPCVFIVERKSAAETFSWLKVYSPETFPLSQFGRIVSSEDWTLLELQSGHSVTQARHDRWASIIVGEALAQGDTDIELAQLPLARASACFTTAIARTSSIYGTESATRICADRLRKIESDRRFLRRPISVADLLPIWAMAGISFQETLLPQDAIEFILSAIETNFPTGTRSGLGIRANLDAYPELKSDYIEKRVVAFQALGNELLRVSDRSRGNVLHAALVAAAAFMVGRGTSHQFLVCRLGKQFPTAIVWFSLIAALAGPETWDQHWLHATKGVERQIRSDFHWDDLSGFDMSWEEFAWLLETFDGLETFASLTKLTARAMSVELLPGAVFQFRLSSPLVSNSERKTANSISEREVELRAALAQFVNLATRSRTLLETDQSPVQHPIVFDAESAGNVSKPKRARPKEK